MVTLVILEQLRKKFLIITTMRVKYSLIFLTGFLTFSTACHQDISPLSGARSLFHKAPPPVKETPIYPDLQTPLNIDQSNQFAFQADQLNTILTLNDSSAFTAIVEPDFKAEDLDSAMYRLFRYPENPPENPYGFAENETIDYPDSIYRKRFRLITSEVPLVYNHQVKNYIDLYAGRRRDLTQRMFGKRLLYYPYIEQVLAEKQLPDELKHLVMVESAMETEATSSMAAVGLWQIRYATGRDLGLKINSVIDERLDPYAATEAAISYLEKLYGLYDDWLLAIAAYNCGLGNLNKAIVRSGGSRNFWRVNRYLPQETRSYIPAFMALVYLNHFQPEHNLRPVYPLLSFRKVDTVRLYHEVPLEKIAATSAVSLNELKFLNPALIKDRIPYLRDGYRLVLPINKLAQFEEQRSRLLVPIDYAAEVDRTARISKHKQSKVPDSTNLTKLVYQVRKGNTMIGIARRYGCSVKDIQAWNGKSDHRVWVGEELNIYLPSSRSAR